MKVLGVGGTSAPGVGTRRRGTGKKAGYGTTTKRYPNYYGRSLPSKPNGSFPALSIDRDAPRRDTPYESLEQPRNSSTAMAGRTSNSWKHQVSKLNCIVCVAGGVPTDHPLDNDHRAAAAEGSAALSGATSRGVPGDTGKDRKVRIGRGSRPGDEEETDSYTLDHTHDETATSTTGADESHGGWSPQHHQHDRDRDMTRRGPPGGRQPADSAPYRYDDDDFDVVEQDIANGGGWWRSSPPPVTARGTRSTSAGGAGVGPRFGNDDDDVVGRPAAAIGRITSADSSSHYLSETRTSDSSGLPLDEASFSSTTTSNSSSAEGQRGASSSSRRRGNRPLPPRQRRRQRRMEKQRRKKEKKTAAAVATATSTPRDPSHAAVEDATNPTSELTAEGDPSGRVGIRPFVVPDDVRKRMESNAPRGGGGLDHEYNYFLPTSESNIEFPPAEEDAFDNDAYQQQSQPHHHNEEEEDSLGMYDEDMYYQRAQEILQAAIVASAQSSPERGASSAADEEARPTVLEPAPKDEVSEVISSPPKASVPFNSPPADHDDEEPALDETGGTYDDDDTIATEEAIDHAPTPCPSKEEPEVAAAKSVTASNVGGGNALRTSSEMPSTAPRHHLQAMVRSPSQGDSPVTRSSRMGSQFNLQAASPKEIESLRPEDLSSKTRDPATPPRSIQETLQKLESLNLQRRADREAFESPSRAKSTGRKTFDGDSPLRASKSFPEDSVKSVSTETKRFADKSNISSRSGDDAESKWGVEDPFEIRKSPSSPPSFSDTETDERKQPKDEGLPPSIPQLRRTVPPAPPPSPSTNGHTILGIHHTLQQPPPPPPPPPPNTPAGTAPANSIPSSPASSTASSKLKTLIDKFESTPTRTRSASPGPRQLQQRPTTAVSPASEGRELTKGSVRKVAPMSVAPAKTASSVPESSQSNEAISRPPPSLVASTRLKYSATSTPTASRSLPPASPRAPTTTPESSPRSFGMSVRKVPSSRRGLSGSPTHPSPRGSLVKQHPTWNRFPPNASPPSESSRQPLQSTTRSTPGRMGASQTLHLTPPVLTQQRRANRPISASKAAPSPASPFFWRSYPTSGEEEPELTQQPSLESLVDVLTNSTNEDTTASPSFDEGRGSVDGKHQRLGDYEQMLLTKRQEARRQYEEANKPPWAKKTK